MDVWARRARGALPWIATLLFVGAGLLAWRALEQYGWSAVRASLASIEPATLARATGLVAASYATLTLSDALAVRAMTRARVAYPRIALTSFIAVALGHTVGFGTLSSGAVRLRFYGQFGLGLAEVARVVLFCGTTVGLGLLGVGGGAALLQPSTVATLANLGGGVVLGAGAAAWLAVVAYVSLAARAGGRVRIRGREQPLPTGRVALLQVAVGCVNYVLIAAALYQLVARGSELSLASFAGLYSVANVLAIVTHVPGGFGVLELVLVTAVPGVETVGALVAFRIVYNFVPFLVAALIYGTFELARRGRAARAPLPRQ